MSARGRREYLAAIHRRYRNGSRKEKSIILKEFCTNCGYHPKHAIRLLTNFKHFIKPKHREKGRESLYNKGAILKPLKRIWLGANLPCSKRLKAILPLWLPGYLQNHGDLNKEAIEQLLTISHATIDRIHNFFCPSVQLISKQRIRPVASNKNRYEMIIVASRKNLYEIVSSRRVDVDGMKTAL